MSNFDNSVEILGMCKSLGVTFKQSDDNDDTLRRIKAHLQSVSAELDKAGVPELGSLLERVKFLADQLPNYPLIPDP